MVADREVAAPPANRLLGLLRPGDHAQLRPHPQRLPLKYKQSLYRARKPIGYQWRDDNYTSHQG